MNKIVLDYHKGDSVLKLLKDQFGGSVKQKRCDRKYAFVQRFI